MRLFALVTLAALGFVGTASADHKPRYYQPAPAVNFGVVTPGFSFGYSSFAPSYYRPGWDYGYRGHYHSGRYVWHGDHWHYIPGHYHRR